MIDLAIGVGIPLLQVVFRESCVVYLYRRIAGTDAPSSEYIVSGHRFDIYEGIGCSAFTYNTPLAYPFSLLWPLVIALISACYCGMCLNQILMLDTRLTFNHQCSPFLRS